MRVSHYPPHRKGPCPQGQVEENDPEHKTKVPKCNHQYHPTRPELEEPSYYGAELDEHPRLS